MWIFQPEKAIIRIMDQMNLFDDSAYATPLYRSLWLYRRPSTPDSAITSVLKLVPESYGRECSVYTDAFGRYDMWFRLHDEIGRYKGGLLILMSLGDIGRTKDAVLSRFRWLIERRIEVVIADCPATMIFERPKDNRLALQVACDIYASIEGWPKMKPDQMWPGRSYPDEWDGLYVKWKNREIPTSELEKVTPVSHNTFYKMLNAYKSGPEGDIRTWRIR